jgi:5-oxoprolinase (ATP-hydrolysing) subunit A
MQIDLNSDLGEGCGHDIDLMGLITSANISCGFHAGDIGTAYQALKAAAEHGVCVGAHPGFADHANFGRVEIDMTEEQITELCLYQVGALGGLARMVGKPLSYIKPHGALYNMACREERFARPVIKAAVLLELPLLALPVSRLEELSRGRVRFFREGFADRRYLADGALVPRSRPNAFVTDPEEAVRQAGWLIRERGVQSLCVHGDDPQALDFVRHLRMTLERQGYELRSFISDAFGGD